MNNSEMVSAYQKGIEYIIKHLDWELPIRTGFESAEYLDLLYKIKINDLKDLAFTDKEATMLHQMLNEICNGLMIPDFINEIGIPIEDAKKLLEAL